MEIEQSLVVELEEGEEVRVRKVGGFIEVVVDWSVDQHVGKRVVFE